MSPGVVWVTFWGCQAVLRFVVCATCACGVCCVTCAGLARGVVRTVVARKRVCARAPTRGRACARASAWACERVGVSGRVGRCLGVATVALALAVASE